MSMKARSDPYTLVPFTADGDTYYWVTGTWLAIGAFSDEKEPALFYPFAMRHAAFVEHGFFNDSGYGMLSWQKYIQYYALNKGHATVHECYDNLLFWLTQWPIHGKITPHGAI